MRRALLALVLGACSSKSAPPPATAPSDAPIDAAIDAAPPSIPAAPPSITLATVERARRVAVPSASTFVAVDASGAVSGGKLTADAPYRGATIAPGALTATLDAADGRPPAEPLPITITAAPHPGEPPIPMSRRARGTLADVGALDTIVLADATARAEHAGRAITDVHGRAVGLGVGGDTAPQRLRYVFTSVHAPHAKTDIRVRLTADALTFKDAAGALHDIAWADARAKLAELATAARPVLDAASVLTVELSQDGSVHQLTDVLATLAAAGVPAVDLALPNGTSVSFGGGTGKKRVLPRLTVEVTGGPETSRRTIRRGAQRYLYCYEQQLVQEPTLAGTVTAQLTLPVAGGTAEPITATGMTPALHDCVTRALQVIQFPPASDNRAVTTTVKLIYQPTR
jgi:hypothetical protein